MLQIVREFRVEMRQLRDDSTTVSSAGDFVSAQMTVAVCVEGPLYNGDGVERMLAEVVQSVGYYLQNEWSGRWFVDSVKRARQAQRLKIPYAQIPGGNTCQHFADYLLDRGIEPLLRPLGLLCRGVEVRVMNHEPAVALLPNDLVDRYEAEIDPKYRPPKRRSAPFSARKATATRGFGISNQWSVNNPPGKQHPVV